MADVFISYKKEDRALAELVAGAFEAYKLETWFDSSLAGGQAFRSAIGEELRKAKAVIVIWSKRSVRSDWVLDEADYAKGYAKLVPVQFSRDFEIPFGFRQIQVEDLQGWTGDPHDPRIRRLVEQVGRISQQPISVLAQAIGPNLRAGAADAVRSGNALFQSFAGATYLGLPLTRLLGRGIVASLALGLLIAVFASNGAWSWERRLADGMLVAAPFFFIVRALHQYVMYKKGVGSRRVFDPPFRFWIWVSALLSVMGVGLYVNDITNVGEVMRHLPLTFVLIFSAIVLFRTFLSLFAPDPGSVAPEGQGG